MDEQRRAHLFLLEKFRNQETFTREEFRQATGWADTTFNTYWSKQFKTLLLPARGGRHRVSEVFRRFITWDSFRQHVTQNRHVALDYEVLTYDNVMIFEFFMPLTNEGYLRTSLDALFYKDSIISRLKTVDEAILHRHFPRTTGESDEHYFGRICDWVSEKFSGYSISHVAGRFRASELKTMEEASGVLESGEKYLIDETTAIVRFIFPCGQGQRTRQFSSEGYFEDLALQTDGTEALDEAGLVRLMFFTLFVQSIVLTVNGEDEIWMLESGMQSRLHVWRVQE